MNLFFVIPFFNNTQFLKETLQSLIDQTAQNWSAVVLDDSLDAKEASRASALVQSFSDSRIRYHKNPQNLGLAKNWNQGLEMGLTSEAIAILHADDVLKPNYVSSMQSAFRDFPNATAIFCKTAIINEVSEPVFSFADWYKTTLLPAEQTIQLKGVKGIEWLIPGNFVFCPTLCFRTALLKNERFNPSLKMVLDFELILRILLKEELLVGLYKEPLYLYRRHQKNTTNTHTQSLLRFKEERDLYLELSETLRQKNEPALAKAARQMKVVKLNLTFNLVKALIRFQFRSASNIFKFLLSL